MFSRVIGFSLHQRVLVMALALALLALGIWVTPQLPVDVLPDVTRPTVTVQAEAPGLSPTDTERLVTLPLEAALGGLPGLERLRSITSPGLVVLYLEFAWDSPPLLDRQWTAERIDALRPQLAGLAELRLAPLASLMGEVLHLGLRAQGATTLRALRTLADYAVRPQLLAVPGVAQVTVIGGQVRQFEVQPDAARLRLWGLGLEDLVSALRGTGTGAGLGATVATGQDIPLRALPMPLDFDTLDQIAVGWQQDHPIRLGQVATLAAGHAVPRGDAGVDGTPGVILSVLKQPGADTLALTRAVQARVETLQAQWPNDVQAIVLFRQADFIEAATGNVREALALAMVFAGLVLIAFFTGSRALWVSLTVIPLSLVAALLVLHGLGWSLNTMTLGGLAIAIGELVDDAVVAVENILRRRRESPPLASLTARLALVTEATVEVRSGILHATLLVMLAFVPLLWLPGLEGRLFVPLGVAYLTAIGCSLLVAVTVTPVLAFWWLADPRRAPVAERRWLARLKARYAAGLARALARPGPVYALAVLVLATAAVTATRLPRAFLPPFQESSITLNLLLPPGVSLDTARTVAQAAERLVLGVPEVLSVGRRTGRAEGDEHAEGLHYTEMDLRLHETGRTRAAVVADLRTRLAPLPAGWIIGQPISHRLDHLLSGVRAPLVVKIHGDDLPTLRTLAQQAQARLAALPGLRDVQMEPQVDVPEWHWQIEPRQAATFGLSPARVQQNLATLTAGQPLSVLREGERLVPLVLRLPASALTPDALAQLPIDSPQGPIPLGWLGTMAAGAGPYQLLREDRQRRIAILAYPGEGDFGTATDAARQVIATLPQPEGTRWSVEGTGTAERGARARIAGLGLASLGLIVALLVGHYRDRWRVGIVLASLPLSLAGGVLALAFTSTPLSVASLIGFVTLTGIAARNSLLKLGHYARLHAGESAATGMADADPQALIVRGSVERLTPVLLTALIAALTLLPLLRDAARPGQELLHPVALVLFGGLLCGTVFDSLLTPLLYRHWAPRIAAVGGDGQDGDRR